MTEMILPIAFPSESGAAQLAKRGRYTQNPTMTGMMSDIAMFRQLTGSKRLFANHQDT
jgi:hypothetical protein